MSAPSQPLPHNDQTPESRADNTNPISTEHVNDPHGTIAISLMLVLMLLLVFLVIAIARSV